MKGRGALAGLFIWILAVPAFIVAGDGDSRYVPKLSGYVNDTANILQPRDRVRLSGILQKYEKETHHQIALLTLPSLGEETIEALSLRTANAWHLGLKGVDDGILVTLAMQERRVRIALGIGMQRYISDADAKQIIDSDMIPAFSKGDYLAGIEHGLNRLMEEGRRFLVTVPATSLARPEWRESGGPKNREQLDDGKFAPWRAIRSG